MRNSARKIAIVFSLIAAPILLMSCSSGGDDNNQDTTDKPVPSTVKGSTVKGVIKNATIDIYPIENGVISDTILVSAATSNNGTYSVTIPETYSGPVHIVLHNNSSNSATMTCDAISCRNGGFSFGQDMPLGQLELRTLVAHAAGGTTQSASVTPYTTLAAAYADSIITNGYTAEIIATANSKVGNLLGIQNIITTSVPDITNTTSTTNSNTNNLLYAYLSAAIEQVAELYFAGDIGMALSQLTSQYVANGGELISNESAPDANIISLREIANSAATVASIYGDNGNVYNTLWSLQQIAADPMLADQLTTTTPSPTSGLGNLDIVKAFVTDVRTWGTVINNEIESRSTVFDDQAIAASNTFTLAEPLLDNALRYATQAAAFAILEGDGTTLDLSTYFDPNNPVEPVTATGTATVSQNSVILNGVINNVDTNLTYVYPNLVGTTFTAGVTGSVNNGNASISISTGAITFDYATETDISNWADGTAAAIPDPDRGSLDLNVILSQEGVADPISFEGNISVVIVGSQDEAGTVRRDSLGNVLNYNFSNATFSGTFGNTTGDQFTALVTATMPNADTFFPLTSNFYVGYTRPDVGSYNFSNLNNTMTLTLPEASYTFEYDTVTQFVTITETNIYYGTYEYTDYYLYASLDEFLTSGYHWIFSYPYAYVAGEGDYYLTLPAIWDTAGGNIAGTLQWVASVPDEDSTNYRELTDLMLSFTAQLNGLPSATFSISGNRTGFEDGDASLTIAYGGRSIVVSAQVIATQTTGDIVITNQDGARLVFTQGDTNNAVLTYDDVVYATITDSNGVKVIRYIDGYFEVM